MIGDAGVWNPNRPLGYVSRGLIRVHCALDQGNNAIVLLVPGYEVGDSRFNGRRRMESNGGVQFVNIGVGVQYVTGLHRQKTFFCDFP
jgi:hypothetical protein